MRARKLFFVLFVALLTLAQCQTASASDYEIGPLHVDGIGVTPPEAMEDAYGNMGELVASIAATLPPGEHVIYVEVLNAGYVTPNLYEIDFMIGVGTIDELPPFGGGGM